MSTSPASGVSAACKATQFLNSEQARKVLELIERTRTGLPASAVPEWNGDVESFEQCPYFQMHGSHSPVCRDSCHLYEIAVRENIVS